MCPHAAAVEVERDRESESIYCIDVGKFQHFVYCSPEDSRKNMKVLQIFLQSTFEVPYKFVNVRRARFISWIRSLMSD